MFSRRDIKALLGRYSLVQLYTDSIPAQFQETSKSADQNRQFLNDRFGTAQLPLYVIVKPTAGGGFDEVDRYVEGKINDLAAFTEFLQKPLARSAGLEPPGAMFVTGR